MADSKQHISKRSVRAVARAFVPVCACFRRLSCSGEMALELQGRLFIARPCECLKCWTSWPNQMRN